MRLLLLLVVLSACSLAAPELLPSSPRAVNEALWVFTDEVHEEEARSRLVAYAASQGITRLYVSMYQPRPNSAGRRLFEEDAIAAFVRLAHQHDIEVWVAFGATTWHLVGAAPGSAPHARLLEVLGYNRDHPDAALDGVMLDLEPEEPADLEALLTTYQQILAVLRPADVRVAGAIRFFWDRPLTRAGLERPAFQHFVDLDLDHLVVMAYRHYAGGRCPDDGIICLSEDEMAYAHEAGRDGFIVVGLRTTSVATDGGLPKATFHGRPPAELQRAREEVHDHFASSRSFGGFAVHRYQRAAP